MKKILYLFVFLCSLSTIAQHSISGSFSPAEHYQWLLAYKMEPGGQNYVADTRITNGQFTLNLPENSSSGTYRLVYAVPQEEFFFDVIYNGKEDISLRFSTSEGLTFQSSSENKLFASYFRDLQKQEQKIIEFYASGNTNTDEFLNLIQQLSKTQETYENSSRGLLIHQFILANKPYIPAAYESAEVYVKNKKGTYFNNLNLGDEELQASGFLVDKLSNYVFTALPMVLTDALGTEQAIKDNIGLVHDELEGVATPFKLRLYNTLWSQASAAGLNETADYIYTSYLKEVAVAQGDLQLIQKIEVHNRLRLGATAPDILWKAGEDLKKLSALENAENYVLAFWSSTCSHCLSELPKLHSGIQENKTALVLAVGLEDGDQNWKKESAKLPNFEHAISLGKWESEYANLYAIQKTPTYYILDGKKKIIAKPEDYQEVLEFLKTRGN
ncbi:MAG: TlpA family protein disulfide reductase [Flavobacteriaceae bacterium]